jgi:hypothetical protein
VTNVKDLHCLSFDGEENPIDVGVTAVEELPHLKRETLALRSK